MNFIEFIGFIVSILLMAFIVIRNIWQGVQKSRHPQGQGERQAKQQTTLKQFLESLAGDMQETVEQPRKTSEGSRRNPPPPPMHRNDDIDDREDQPQDSPRRLIKDDFRFQSKMDKFQSKNAIENRTLQNSIEKREASFESENIVSEELRMAAVDSAYDIVNSKKRARVNMILERLKSKKRFGSVSGSLWQAQRFRGLRCMFKITTWLSNALLQILQSVAGETLPL